MANIAFGQETVTDLRSMGYAIFPAPQKVELEKIRTKCGQPLQLPRRKVGLKRVRV